MREIKVVGHQPQYMPYLGILNKISKADIYIIVDHVQYVKKYFYNRTYIKINNQSHLLTIPVNTKGSYASPINSITIDKDSNWKRKHLKSIQLGYSKAKFFDFYYDKIADIYNSDYEKLSDLTSDLLIFFLKEFELVEDIRFSSTMDITGAKTDLLVDLTNAVNGTTYISGEGAKVYFDEDTFAKSGLKHLFNEFQHPEYSQIGNDFIQGMGCIDLLMNCGKDGRKFITDKVV